MKTRTKSPEEQKESVPEKDSEQVKNTRPQRKAGKEKKVTIIGTKDAGFCAPGSGCC